MKIYQIFYDELSKSKLNSTFIPYDNRMPAKPCEFEYGVMRKLYYDKETWKNNELFGVVSWKFQDKTGVTPETFTNWINNNYGLDVYHINPYYLGSKKFFNVWRQGEVCHPGLIEFATNLFVKAGLDTELLHLQHSPEVTCYCNYWVASRNFWDVYMSYADKLYSIIYDCDQPTLDRLFHVKADRFINSGMFSFIFERMFSTVLAKHQEDFSLLPYFTSKSEVVKIDLGCGSRKKEGAIGFDCQKLPGVDFVGDANERLPFEDNVADIVYAHDFLEHVRNDRRIHIMTEIWRILKPGGILDSITPSTDGRGAFQDPTHYSFWNINSFMYYTRDDYRSLYGIVPKFDIIELKNTNFNSIGVCNVIAKLKAVK